MKLTLLRVNCDFSQNTLMPMFLGIMRHFKCQSFILIVSLYIAGLWNQILYWQ